MFFYVILVSQVFAEEQNISKQVVVITINGPIGPATSDYVLSGLDDAINSSAELVLLKMDTPGGLDTAMRDIIQGIISSPIP